MKFDLSYDAKMHKWRLSNPGTGEVRECRSVVPLVVALYQEVSFTAFGQPIPYPEVEMYEALGQDLMDFWVNHGECDEVRPPKAVTSATSDTWPCDTCERDIDKKYGWCPFCSPEKASIQACPLCHADPETRDDCKRCDGDGFIDVGVVAGERATARPEDAPHPGVGGGTSVPLAASGEKCEVCDETGGKGTIWVYDKLNVEENGRWEPCPECGSVDTEETDEKPLRGHVEAFMTAAEGKRVPAPPPINSADGTFRIGGAAWGQSVDVPRITGLDNYTLAALRKASQEREDALRFKLIELGWTPPAGGVGTAWDIKDQRSYELGYAAGRAASTDGPSPALSKVIAVLASTPYGELKDALDLLPGGVWKWTKTRSELVQVAGVVARTIREIDRDARERDGI